MLPIKYTSRSYITISQVYAKIAKYVKWGGAVSKYNQMLFMATTSRKSEIMDDFYLFLITF